MQSTRTIPDTSLTAVDRNSSMQVSRTVPDTASPAVDCTIQALHLLIKENRDQDINAPAENSISEYPVQVLACFLTFSTVLPVGRGEWCLALVALGTASDHHGKMRCVVSDCTPKARVGPVLIPLGPKTLLVWR